MQLLGREHIEGEIIHLDSLIKGEFAENEYHESWKVSERVAILDAIETIGTGGHQVNKRQNFATSSEAAKQAGLGNKETARQASKVVHDGVPELVEAVDKGDVSISAASKIVDLPNQIYPDG